MKAVKSIILMLIVMTMTVSCEYLVQQLFPSLEPEREFLMQIYQKASGREWHNDTGWCSDKPLGEWYGVEVDAEGYVIALNLRENGLFADDLSLDLQNLSRLQQIDVSDNCLGRLTLRGNGSLQNVTLERCASESISIYDVPEVCIVDCDSLSSIGGNFTKVLIKDCDFRHDSHTPCSIEASEAHVVNCHMHSCGISSQVLVFEKSSTYDTWYCNTESRLEIVASYCSTICGGDFMDDTDIVLNNATLWRSNWDEESLVTLTASIKGSQWGSLFE